MSLVKSSCIRTPWPPVTIIAAYADPCRCSCLMMIPALDQGWTPTWPPATARGLAARQPAPARPPPYRPVSDVTRTVMLPLPVSGWRTK